MASQP
jgi:DNA primase large subunit